jgi:hypothetical protein
VALLLALLTHRGTDPTAAGRFRVRGTPASSSVRLAHSAQDRMQLIICMMPPPRIMQSYAMMMHIGHAGALVKILRSSRRYRRSAEVRFDCPALRARSRARHAHRTADALPISAHRRLLHPCGCLNHQLQSSSTEQHVQDGRKDEAA